MSSKESIGKTFVVAGILCVVCSFLVSVTAIGLRDRQELNALTDKRMNILAAAGVLKDGMDVNDVYTKSVEVKYLDLATGEYILEPPAPGYDSIKAAKDPEYGIPIPADKDLADIKRRAKISEVYLFRENNEIAKIILPIRGKGLWSTLMGFAAVETDGSTVSGLTFYDHKETPGLGGEIDNPNWKAQWPGKKIYAANGTVGLKVLKGTVVRGNPNEQYEVDGLAGATITARGVSNLVQYWFGAEGYMKYLAKFGGEG